MKKIAVAVLAVFSTVAFAQDRVAKFDKNGDEKVELVELKEVCEVNKSLFERADKNGDGMLSNVEMRTAKGYLFSKCKKEEKNV